MFRKYEKTYRISIPELRINGKFTLTKKEQIGLLTGRISVEEKMDGANTAIIRNKRGWTLQKRRGLADEGVHQQFSFFWNWARHNEEKIMNIPIGWIVYGELMYAKHNIYYDELPSYWLVFDIWNKRKYLRADERNQVAEELGFQAVPLLYFGNERINPFDFMYKKSRYSKDLAEGIVIKNYRKQTRGKLVRKEFIKQLEEEDHWLNQKLVRNKISALANSYD